MSSNVSMQTLRGPRDLQLEVRRDSRRLEVKIPPSGLSTEALGQAMFTVVWLGVTLTWTAGMLRGNAPWFVIAFSLVFWGSGASMMLNIGRMIFANEVIILDPDYYSISTEVLGHQVDHIQGTIVDLVGPPEVECEEHIACRILLEDLQMDAVYAAPEVPRLRRAEAKWLQTTLKDHLVQLLGTDFGAAEQRTTDEASHGRDRNDGQHTEQRPSRQRRQAPGHSHRHFHPVGGGLPIGGVGGFGGFAVGPGFAFVLR